MKKKILALLLAAVMVLPLVACGGNGGNSENKGSENKGTEVEGTEDGSEDKGGIALDKSWPEETIKIGIVGYDSTNEQQMEVQAYFEYMAEYYNIEIMVSENLADAEGELNFIANCAAAGCKGIVAYYNVALEEAAKACAEYGMFYWGGFGGDMEAYEAVKDNEYYLGGYTLGDAEYNAGVSMAEALIAQGCEKIVFCSGGAAFGIPMFIDRKAGFVDTINKAKEEGKNVEIVYEIEGWPGTDAFVAAQTTAIGMDIDAIACTFDSAMWFQVVMDAEKQDTVSLACVGSVSDMYKGFVNSGLVTCIVYDNVDVTFGNAIPMILNAVDGHKLVNADGSAPLFGVQRWTVTSADQFNAIYDLYDGGGYVITAEDIANLIIANNPDMTTEKFGEFYGNFTLESFLNK